MKHKLWRHAIRWAVGGCAYMLLELCWRGHTHWTMGLLAAVLCIPLDLANEYIIPWETPLWMQAIFGGLTVTGAELCAGLVLNVWLGLGIWDYSKLPGNLWGQICPQFTALWCLLCLAVIPAFDWMEYALCGGRKPEYTMRLRTGQL